METQHSSSPRMQTIQSYSVCIEQNVTSLLAAIDGCRVTLHLMHKDLVESEHYIQYHAERSRQYHQVSLNLLHERDQTARETERLQKNVADAKREIQQLTEINDVLQKRLFELELSREDYTLETEGLNTRIAILEAERVNTSWKSPIGVKFPPQQSDPLSMSPESSLDLNTEGTELVKIMLDRRDLTGPSGDQ
ncbi:hypothetical protein H2200_013612 [Cladophialophora chaetospira]|uniref:Uncharacterized protein n=1 Tax=Cladophialophora chaetospira TaxID=386627 RepID=A0AA38WP81_9EURO|nr:hypothetical protein H2200_013612 [Cladophialophora chaetospira]